MRTLTNYNHSDICNDSRLLLASLFSCVNHFIFAVIIPYK